LSIKVFYDHVNFRLKGSEKIREFLNEVIITEEKVLGDLNFVFTSDERLLEINKEFLRHNYFTDVISFENNNGRIVNGEIYISIERVRENAVKYKTKVRLEIIRVMIHGLLHLCGYRDETEEERKIMTGRQEGLVKNFEVKG
jgi:probable rRNA maturation factor